MEIPVKRLPLPLTLALIAAMSACAPAPAYTPATPPLEPSKSGSMQDILDSAQQDVCVSEVNIVRIAVKTKKNKLPITEYFSALEKSGLTSRDQIKFKTMGLKVYRAKNPEDALLGMYRTCLADAGIRNAGTATLPPPSH